MWEIFTGTEGNIALGAVLGAGGTLIAQAAAGFTGLIKELLVSRKKRRDEARYLALRTILLLDEFVGQCYGACHDSPEFNPSDPGEFKFRNPQPDLVLPNDTDWRLLEPKLMEQIVWLPAHFKNVRDGLSSLDVFPPDYDDFFEHRTEHYATLGLRALNLLEGLCDEYKIKEPERPSYYNPRKGFAEKQTAMKQYWEKRNREAKVMFAEMELKRGTITS